MIGAGWDEDLPSYLRTSWLTFKNSLPDVESMSIPRWLETYKTSSWSLHGFYDASDRAYAAVIYTVCCFENSVSSQLIAAKSKGAPIKTLRIPKLELAGAMLLLKLVAYYLSKLNFQPTQVFCRTDSQVVLSWLQSHPSRWKPFAVNRLSEITSVLTQASWRHVCSSDNSAAVASRGSTHSELRESNQWSPRLKLDESEWPYSTISMTNTDAKLRKCAHASDIFVTYTVYNWSPLLEKLSSLDKIICILVYILSSSFS